MHFKIQKPLISREKIPRKMKYHPNESGSISLRKFAFGSLIDEIKNQIHFIQIIMDKITDSYLINLQTFSLLDAGMQISNKTTNFPEIILDSSFFIKHSDGSLCMQIYYKNKVHYTWVALQMAKDGSKWENLTKKYQMRNVKNPEISRGALFHKGILILPHGKERKLLRREHSKAKLYSVEIKEPELNLFSIEKLGSMQGISGKYELFFNAESISLKKRSIREPLCTRVKTFLKYDLFKNTKISTLLTLCKNYHFYYCNNY